MTNPQAPPPPLLPAAASSAYGDLTHLGRGGMGDVYAARELGTGRPVALKVIRPDLTRQEEAVRRFRREVEAMKRLFHPHVVRVLDFQEGGGRAVLVMEYLNGMTLQERIDRGGLPVGEAADLVAQAADGLAAVHAAGILHRDIKPHNIFVTRESRAKLMDFGVAALTDDAGTTPLTPLGLVMGTARFLPPEAITAVARDERSDVYSLGLVLYEALTGEFPLAHATLDEIASGEAVSKIPPPSARNPAVDETLDQIVRQAVASHREGRFASAAVFRDALRSWAQATWHGAAPTTRPHERARLLVPQARPRVHALAIRIAVALLGLLALWCVARRIW